MIWVFGDSFSTAHDPRSWTRLIGAGRIVSHNGISEFRILRAVEEHVAEVNAGDVVVVCHTNALRVFLPDHVGYPARAQSSHPHCDLVIGDAMTRSWLWRSIAWVYGTYFFDEAHLRCQHRLMIEEIERLLAGRGATVLHVSGFECSPPVESFHDLFLGYRGTINHMTAHGNALLAARLSERIGAA